MIRQELLYSGICGLAFLIVAIMFIAGSTASHMKQSTSDGTSPALIPNADCNNGASYAFACVSAL